MKGLALDLPYPSLDGIENDYCSAMIISPAYAGKYGELTAILQYMYHSLYFEKAGLKEYSKILDSIAITEMEHIHILGTLLLKLGVNPVFCMYPPNTDYPFNTSGILYSELPQKIILDDISTEMLAINDYNQMLYQLKNERVGEVIQRIKLDEELHVKTLKEMYIKLSGVNCFCGINGI